MDLELLRRPLAASSRRSTQTNCWFQKSGRRASIRIDSQMRRMRQACHGKNVEISFLHAMRGIVLECCVKNDWKTVPF
jgi:hypothetical protein